MQVLFRALGFFGIRSGREKQGYSDYEEMMRQALDRVGTAERMIQEAGTLEQLDLARSDLQAAQAQIQQVIRQAKRDRGIALRPIAETEEMYRRMREYMHGQGPDRPTRGKRGGRTG